MGTWSKETTIKYKGFIFLCREWDYIDYRGNPYHHVCIYSNDCAVHPAKVLNKEALDEAVDSVLREGWKRQTEEPDDEIP